VGVWGLIWRIKEQSSTHKERKKKEIKKKNGLWHQTGVHLGACAINSWRRHWDEVNAASKQPFWLLESTTLVV
jgi:hypothetical protein